MAAKSASIFAHNSAEMQKKFDQKIAKLYDHLAYRARKVPSPYYLPVADPMAELTDQDSYSPQFHYFCNFIVFEAFVCHYMTPMTTCISYT